MVLQCINIRQPSASVFNTSHRTWRMLMHEKTMFDRYSIEIPVFDVNSVDTDSEEAN